MLFQCIFNSYFSYSEKDVKNFVCVCVCVYLGPFAFFHSLNCHLSEHLFCAYWNKMTYQFLIWLVTGMRLVFRSSGYLFHNLINLFSAIVQRVVFPIIQILSTWVIGRIIRNKLECESIFKTKKELIKMQDNGSFNFTKKSQHLSLLEICSS